MARCDYCGARTVVFPVRDGDKRYCNARCHDRGRLRAVADTLPPEWLAQRVAAVHQGACPKCGGPGPTDLYTSHTVWSAIYVTRWRSIPKICCHACGSRAQIRALLQSLLLGWWGLPWGLLMTPATIGHNIWELCRPPDPSKPSSKLEKLLRLSAAAEVSGSQAPKGAGEWMT